MAQAVKTNKAGLALEGYDTVAYFTEGRPTLGDPTITTEWNGATWQFASADNRDTFLADPERYAPRFGGHCAVARAQGMHVKASPQRWRIENGELFLNKNAMAFKFHPVLAKRIHKISAKERAAT